MRKLERYFWIVVGLLTVLICVFLYAGLSKSNGIVGGVFLFFALLILLLALVVLYKERSNRIQKGTGEVNAHTMVNSLERVFKVITAEGHFTEIVDFKDTKTRLPILRSTKKALIIVKAKVQMGYDFSKLEWEGDEEQRILNLKSVPKPEILSISPEIKYYNLENGIFNKFKNEDLNAIQTQCIDFITKSALESNLPQLAAQQAKFLLTEMAEVNKWQVQGIEQLQLQNPTA